MLCSKVNDLASSGDDIVNKLMVSVADSVRKEECVLLEGKLKLMGNPRKFTVRPGLQDT